MERLVESFDPYYVVAHNSNFDILKLRGIGFKGGVESKRRNTKGGPVLLGSGAFYNRLDYLGRNIIDTLALSLNYFPLPRNNLDTVFEFFFGYLKEKATGGDYDLLETWAQEAKNDPFMALKIARYCAEDAIKTWLIANAMKKPLIIASRALRQKENRIVFTSKDRLGLETHEELQFKRLGTYGYRTLESREALERFNMAISQNRSIRRLLPNRAFKGTIETATLFIPTPYIAGFERVLKSDGSTRELLEEFQKTEDLKEKLFYAQVIYTYLRKAAFDLQQLSKNELEPRADWFFGKIFGIEIREGNRTRNVATLKREVDEAFERLCERLERYEITNYSPPLPGEKAEPETSSAYSILLIKGSAQEDFGNLGFGVLVDNNTATSFGLGRFAFRINGSIISPGIDLYAKQGDRMPLEKELIPKIITLILDRDFKGIESIIRENVSSLRSGRMEKGMVFVSRIARRDFRAYRERAQHRRIVKQQIKEGNCKGEEIGFGFSKKGIVSREEFFSEGCEVDWEAVIDYLYGSRENGKRKLSKGKISTYLTSVFERNRIIEIVDGLAQPMLF